MGAVELTLAFVLIGLCLGAILDFLLNSLPKRIRARMPPATAVLFLLGKQESLFSLQLAMSTQTTCIYPMTNIKYILFIKYII